MGSEHLNFPNVTWAQFSVCNDNATDNFEDMTRSLFYHEFLKEESVPHSDSNQPGIEVEPVLEPPSEKYPHGRLVSFQSKYFKDRISFPQIRHSIQQAAEKYPDRLDHIYLFCNKTINTSNKQYQEIESYLSAKGITLQPISDKDILMLVRKYRPVAEYYFIPRGSPINYPRDMMTTMVSVGFPHTVPNSSEEAGGWTEQLTSELITEKIAECKRIILEMKLKDAKAIINHLLSFGLRETDDVAILFFYKLLIDVFDGSDISTHEVPTQYATEAEWINDFYKKPYEVPVQELNRHLPETQVFAINKMFTAQMWAYLVDLFEKHDKTLYIDEVYTQVKFHAGLSYFNLHDFKAASTILKSLIGTYQDEKYRLFSICSDIGSINLNYRNCQREKHDEVILLLNELDKLSDCDQYKSNEAMVAILSIEAYYNLGLLEERYLDEAIRRIESFSDETKNNYLIKYFKGLCLEVKCRFDEAIKIYLSLDWQNDEMVASRYMFCLIQNQSYVEVHEVYSKLSDSAKSKRAIGVYLLSLQKGNDICYTDVLQKAIQECNESVTDLFTVSFYIDDKDAFIKYVFPTLNRISETQSWNSIPFYVKANFLLKYARFGLFKPMYEILTSIENLHLLDDHFVNVIYRAFAGIANTEYNKHEKAFEADESLQWIDLMAQAFLMNDIMPQKFLTIRYFCAGAWQKPYSMLKISKQLFDIQPQAWIARNIVAVLSELGERDSTAYLPYINILKDSHEPDHCVVTSYAYRRMGQNELADYYIYKALYYLNGVDNFEVYRNCFSYVMSCITQEQDSRELDSIKEKTIAVLKKTKSGETVSICFDSEGELNEPTNRSLGCTHISSGQWEYTKLIGKKINHCVRFHQEEYVVVSIQSRLDYLVHFIFQKIQEKPDEFHGVAWCISGKDTTDLIEQLKRLTDRKDYVRSLIAAYDFKDNALGLPIDAFVSGDYSRYIDALRMLLLTKDLIFHTGQPVIDNFESRKFIPALSTLVLLAQMSWLDYLKPLEKDMIIPQSYSVFFQEQYTHACGLQNVSPGTMYFQDNQVMLIEQDKKIADIWESIIEFCEKCTCKSVSTEERIGLSFGDHISGEQLMSGFKLHVSQMDALILARRENAIYICDDLFFRKLASSIQVENINFVSIVLHYDNSNVFSVFNTLSETNYFLIPYLTQSDDEAMQRLKNHMNGERKAKYYGQYLSNLSRLIRSIFSDAEDDSESNIE